MFILLTLFWCYDILDIRLNNEGKMPFELYVSFELYVAFVLLTMVCLCDVTLSVYPHRAGLKNMPGRAQAYFSSLPGVDIHSE
jgi:hypothetical protein